MRTSWMIVLVLTACSPKLGTEGDATEGDATEGDATEGDATEGDTDDGDTDDDTDGPTSCEAFQSTPDIGPAVTVTVRHEGTTPVFFSPHGCEGALTLSITDAAEQAVPYLLNSVCGPNTCEGFIDASDCSIVCSDCQTPLAGRIETGAVTDVTWPGRKLTQLDLVAECVSEAADGCTTCVRPDQAPAGTYTLTLTVWRTCTGTCECDQPSPEVCGLWRGEQLADPVTFTTTVDYPNQTSVELVITD
jgi:hypothetical protein